MACKAHKEDDTTVYTIPEDSTPRDAAGGKLRASPELQVWWCRRLRNRRDETLLIRQENNPNQADVIELTLGQVYDLIHAAGLAVMRT